MRHLEREAWGHGFEEGYRRAIAAMAESQQTPLEAVAASVAETGAAREQAELELFQNTYDGIVVCGVQLASKGESPRTCRRQVNMPGDRCAGHGMD